MRIVQIPPVGHIYGYPGSVIPLPNSQFILEGGQYGTEAIYTCPANKVAYLKFWAISIAVSEPASQFDYAIGSIRLVTTYLNKLDIESLNVTHNLQGWYEIKSGSGNIFIKPNERLIVHANVKGTGGKFIVFFSLQIVEYPFHLAPI